MPAPSPTEHFEVFRRDVVAPAIYTDAMPLSIEVFQTEEPVTYATAVDAQYTLVGVGFEWGPVWSTAWFLATGEVPTTFAGKPVVFRFDSGTEATLWTDGAPVQGFDVNRDACRLGVPSDDVVEFHVEAACNHPFGGQGLQWDDDEVRRRWESPTPGRLHRCELAVLNEDAQRLDRLYRFAINLAEDLPERDARREQLLGALERATTRLSTGNDFAGAAGHLAETIASPAAGSATICHAVGHAHIDTAWLWPIRETRRKTIRSWANVLGLMDRHPGFRFVCSQAQQYAWLESDAPALFDCIKARVETGHWEPGGAMWIEPDCNVPSGESLIRQIIHGTRYWQDRFGDRGDQRFLYLPDTFGFPASLPQIMAHAGLDTFITNKLSWNDTNPYPHTTFTWRGIDGTGVAAHFTPGHDYNATNSPKELRTGEGNHRDKALGSADGNARWLQPFGFGDGGGGPTEQQIGFADLAADTDALPRVHHGTVNDFCDALQRDREVLRASGRVRPEWVGELYLELHRGTLTTHANLKRENRKLEQLLRAAELLLTAGPAPTSDAGARGSLDEAWKLLLLNQFHDILPGSSITWAYEDARRDHARVRELAQHVFNAHAPRWADAVSGPTVLNTTTNNRPRVVETSTGPAWVAEPTPIGVSVVSGEPKAPATVDSRTLDNGLVRAMIDDAGRVAHLSCAGGNSYSAEPLNQLVLYTDRPRMWDAWDIDSEYEQTGVPLGKPTSIEVVEQSDLRCAIEVTHAVGVASSITQRYVLEAGSPRLDVRTTLDWHEDHRLLRARFPTDLRSHEAIYDIQFGHFARATHRNTSFERARFEVCAHKWMLLAEPDRGLAVLNDGRWGHSCHNGTMGLSLARAPRYPDPTADRGTHEFAYSLLPFVGDWRLAGVDAEAAALNEPLIPIGLGSGNATNWSPVTIDAPNVEVAALKPAEEGDRLIIRIVDRSGTHNTAQLTWHIPVTDAQRVNALEQPIDAPIDHSVNTTTLPLRPFEIVTIAYKRQ